MRVIIVGNNVNKGTRAERELRKAAASDDIHFVPADLSPIRDVDRLASQLAARWPILHRVVLCAGIVRGHFSRTSEGIETNFAVNYLGRFVLTQALLPSLIAGGQAEDPARILIVGGAARNGKINYENVNLTERFNTVRVVSQFCEANDVFVIELARRIAVARDRCNPEGRRCAHQYTPGVPAMDEARDSTPAGSADGALAPAYRGLRATASA
jgi:NAD(P)-dependent dehydrogenase (short-subunit alcohol dehydrogenase family)